MAELKTNAEVIQEADDVQQKTKAALYRIQQQATEAEELGEGTLEEMREQRYQQQRIQMDAEDLNASLTKTKKLQNSFDRWAGNWRGYHKKQAKAEAHEKIAAAERKRQRARVGKENNDAETGKTTASSMVSKGNPRVRSKVVKRPPKRTDLLSSDLANPAVAKLDDESKMGLNRLVKNDNDIDVMLDQTAASLDRLKDLSVAMQEETQTQNKNMDKLTETVDKANSKQAVINARVKRNLTGRWLRRAEAE